jgi:hypothetical protein
MHTADWSTTNVDNSPLTGPIVTWILPLSGTSTTNEVHVDSYLASVLFVEQGITTAQGAEIVPRTLVAQWRKHSDHSLQQQDSLTVNGRRDNTIVQLGNSNFYFPVQTDLTITVYWNDIVGTGGINNFTGNILNLSGWTPA